MNTSGFSGVLAMGLGGLVIAVASILAYVIMSYGIYLLAKKYEPKIHAAWSWIPIAHIYPLVAVSQKPLWLIAVILLAGIIPAIGWLVVLVAIIYVYYGIAKRTGYDVGVTIALTFASLVTIPYLGLQAHKKSTTPAWVVGILAMVLGLIGGGLASIGAIQTSISVAENSDQIQEFIQQSPELQVELEKLREEFENNPELQALKERMEGLNDPTVVE